VLRQVRRREQYLLSLFEPDAYKGFTRISLCARTMRVITGRTFGITRQWETRVHPFNLIYTEWYREPLLWAWSDDFRDWSVVRWTDWTAHKHSVEWQDDFGDLYGITAGHGTFPDERALNAFWDHRAEQRRLTYLPRRTM
jgi:hypothetical protein